jgi:hypothetical protein
MQLTRLLRAADRFLSSPLVAGPGLRARVIWRDKNDVSTELAPDKITFEDIIAEKIKPYFIEGETCVVSTDMLVDDCRRSNDARCYVSKNIDPIFTHVYSASVFEKLPTDKRTLDPLTKCVLWDVSGDDVYNRKQPGSKCEYKENDSINLYLNRIAYNFAFPIWHSDYFGIRSRTEVPRATAPKIKQLYRAKLPGRRLLDLAVLRILVPIAGDVWDDVCVIDPVKYSDGHKENVILRMPEGEVPGFCKTLHGTDWDERRFFLFIMHLLIAYFRDYVSVAAKIVETVGSSSRGSLNNGHSCKFFRVLAHDNVIIRATKFIPDESDMISDILWTLALVEVDSGNDDFVSVSL